jgi:hypothetical protein
MTDTDYSPPAWDWNATPEEVAAGIHARRDPRDEIWLSDFRCALAKEDHQHRCVSRDVEALNDVRDRTSFFHLVKDEIAHLDTIDAVNAKIRRQREEDEIREVEARELERRRAEQAEYEARIEREKAKAELLKGMDPKQRYADRMDIYFKEWERDVAILRDERKLPEWSALANAAFWFAQRSRASTQRELDEITGHLNVSTRNFGVIRDTFKDYRERITELEERIEQLEKNVPQAEERT